MPANSPARRNRTAASFKSYGLTVLLVAAATVIRWGLGYALGPIPTFLTFYPALMLASLFGGLGPGLVATGLGVLAADYFFIPPIGSLTIATLGDAVSLSLFCFIGAFISIVTDRLRAIQAERIEWRSEQRWATTLSSIGDAVIVTDKEGRITFLNAEAERTTGWTRTEALGKPLGTVFVIKNQRTGEPVESPVDKVLRLGTVVGLANHTVLVAKDGREIPIDDSGAPVRDENGTVHGVVLVFRDCTERTEAEERTNRLASFPELNPNPVVEVNGSGEIIFCNPGTFRVLEDLGMESTDCSGFLPGDLNAILGQWDGERESTLQREVSFNNRVFAETIHLVPQFGVARIYAHDITERKEVEERLVQAKKEWERTFASVPDMVAILDDQHRILRVNEAMAQRLGVSPEEALGRRCFEALHGTSGPPDFCPHSRSLKDGRQHIEEVHEDRLGGYFLVSVTPLHDGDGRMIGTVHVAHDITGRKKAEDALKKAYDEMELKVEERTAELQQAYQSLMEETRQREEVEAQLRQAQKMEALGTLSGGIAHDFNNILAAIIGFTELLVDHAEKGSRDERHLKRVMEAGMRGRELVRQLLIFSRKSEHEKRPLLLSPIVKETVNLLRAATPTTIRMSVKTASESGMVLGDPTQIRQVVMNLCTNAVHAMRDKGGVLEIELSDFSVRLSGENDQGMEPGLYMKLTVRDTGVGMEPDIMDKIFDPFFTTKKVGEGTGLGLSVVHGIVKQSKGYVFAESEPGRGSTFTVYFPKTQSESEVSAASDEALPTGSERILFVDDEEALIEMGEDMLAELGYEVTSRTSSTEALALVREDPSRFDLVITDVTMPDITGIDLAREILAIRPDLPVIMCTGHSYLIDAEKAKAMGVKAFVAKPLTKGEIARTIRQVLGA